MSFEPPKNPIMTHHNYILHTLTTWKIDQNNHVEWKATSWPWKQLMGG
jgi:hypothetical protein